MGVYTIALSKGPPLSPAPRHQRQTGEARRTEAARIALELIAERGPDGVTTIEIARRMGVVQAALFKHFPNKDAIWDAATDAIGERIGGRMRAIIAEPGPPLLKVVQALVGYAEITADIPAIAVLLRYTGPGEGAARLHARVTERFDRLKILVESLVRTAAEAGELRPDIDPALLAQLCIACVQAMILETADGVPPDAARIDAQITGLIRLAASSAHDDPD